MTEEKYNCYRFILGVLASILIITEIIAGSGLIYMLYKKWNIMDRCEVIGIAGVLIFIAIISITIYSFMQLVATWNED